MWQGRGRQRAFEIIASLTVLGPSTTSEIEEFVVNSNYYRKIKNKKRKNILRDGYNRIIQNRFEKKQVEIKLVKNIQG